jgi:hypothetical protein
VDKRPDASVVATSDATAGVTLSVFVRRRLGSASVWSQSRRALIAPVLAPSLSAFWSLWNPVWHWCLHRWCYGPLRRRFPRGPSVFATFVASGVVHNLLAVAMSGRLTCFPTVWFACVGVLVVSSEGLRWTYESFPRLARPVPILCHLWLSYRGAGLICDTWGGISADGP